MRKDEIKEVLMGLAPTGFTYPPKIGEIGADTLALWVIAYQLACIEENQRELLALQKAEMEAREKERAALGVVASHFTSAAFEPRSKSKTVYSGSDSIPRDAAGKPLLDEE